MLIAEVVRKVVKNVMFFAPKSLGYGPLKFLWGIYKLEPFPSPSLLEIQWLVFHLC